MTGECSAQRHAGRGDLVFGLHGAHTEVLVLGELVEDVASRGDGIATEEHRQLGQLACSDQTPSERDVAADVGVLARWELGRLDLEPMLELLGRLAEVVAGIERGDVAEPDELVLELGLDPVERPLHRARIQPRDQAEREEVLRTFGVARLDSKRLGGLLGERSHGDFDNSVAEQRIVGQRVGRVPGLRQIALLERVAVDDEETVWLEPAEIGLQRRRVHRDQHARLVARGRDVVIADLHLEARHTVDRACRGTDLGRVLRQRRQVVSERRTDRCEPITSELHAITGITGEPHDDACNGFGFPPGRALCGVRHSHLLPQTRRPRCPPASRDVISPDA